MIDDMNCTYTYSIQLLEHDVERAIKENEIQVFTEEPWLKKGVRLAGLWEGQFGIGTNYHMFSFPGPNPIASYLLALIYFLAEIINVQNFMHNLMGQISPNRFHIT